MTTTPAEARPMSVLIIEDNADTADSLARFLNLGCGCHVTTARDGLTGIRMAVEDCPDVVVCDIGLPRRNGLLVAEELSASLRCRPLLIGVTGYGDQLSAGIAMDAGFDHFLVKPADPFAIQQLIEDHAERMGIGGAVADIANS
jgi:two-component system CheB/CheR fusion protein